MHTYRPRNLRDAQVDKKGCSAKEEEEDILKEGQSP
jgi:hypothetical protein